VIIDDDSQVLAGLKAIIPWDDLGLILVGEAQDGEEGMELIRHIKPDLVITDVYMPVMDGLEMIRNVSETNEFTGKCVILSGYSDFEYARKALRLRVDEYLSKPTSRDTLIDVLKRVTSQLKQQHSTMLKQEEIEDQLKSYETLLERSWLRDVVVGEWIDSSSSIPSEALRKKWSNKRHIVCVIAVHQRKRIKATVTDSLLLRVAARNIVGEIAKKHQIDVEWVDLYNEYSALSIHFNQERKWENVIIQLQNMAADIIESASTYLKLKIMIGIGSAKKEWQLLSESTAEAMQALKEPASYSTLHNQVAVFGVRSEVHVQIKQESKDPSWYYLRIAEAIRFGRGEEVDQLLQQFFHQLEIEGKLTSPDQLRIVGTEVWTAISYSMHHTGMPIDEMFSEMDLNDELRRILYQDELRNWLLTKTNEIFDYWKLDDNLRHRRAIKKTIEYIHEFYNEDIAIQDIAVEVNLSRNYLGQLFIKIVGETFKSYLTRVRMEKARQLLVEGGELLVYEVAESVGYSHVPYFTRQFKQYFGCSPTKLLKEMKEKSSPRSTT